MLILFLFPSSYNDQITQFPRSGKSDNLGKDYKICKDFLQILYITYIFAKNIVNSYNMKEYIPRLIHNVLKEVTAFYPIVTLTGPRQSGKSTLLKHLFGDYRYVNLENPDIREFALKDPRGFLKNYDDKTIIDEAQRVPELFSYLQTRVDEVDNPGMYILAGSHNFLLLKAIKQSLAGRSAILNLLPLSRKELIDADKLPEKIELQIFKGFYPRLYDRDINPTRYYADYVQTYVERDVREVSRIIDLSKFIKFIRLCAARVGQLMNMASLANDCGISVITAEGWLSILESSFILYRLEPNHKNYNKRIIKSPKLYFYDTGLACYLLGIKSADELEISYMKGALFENLVINQFLKNSYNRGEEPDLSFWRDSQGNEIDLLVGTESQMTAYEIKSGQTFNTTYFEGLDKWGKLADIPIERRNVIYAGDNRLTTSSGNLIPISEFYL